METLQLSEKNWCGGECSKENNLQTNHSNTPSQTLQEQCKQWLLFLCWISLLINWRIDLKVREDLSHILLCLVPSVLLSKSCSLQLSEQLDELLYWKQDLPCSKSLGSEPRRWLPLWQQRRKEVIIPHNLLLALVSCDGDLFPNITVSW